MRAQILYSASKDLLRPSLLLAAAGVAGPAAYGQGLVFSLDVGSDLEMSDPNKDGDEVVDPGDVYVAENVVGGLLFATSTYFDDDLLYGGFDPDPVELDFTYATAVPIGAPPPGGYNAFLDLDGFDIIDVDLEDYGIDSGSPLSVPVRKDDFPSNLVDDTSDVRHLLISLNDDQETNWAQPISPRVPVEGTSPRGKTYGGSGRDEIVGIRLQKSATYPWRILNTYTVASEKQVHPDLSPLPSVEANDDDVDALSLGTTADIYLFSVDHEARYGLNAGIIYQYQGAGIWGPMLHPVTHLGLAAGVDIDAFELGWLPDPDSFPPGELSLALLFSVSPDDSNVAGDQSGGLDSAAVYASFLTGDYFELLGAYPSVLYGVDGNVGTGDVYEVDRATGAATLIGSLGFDTDALAADSKGRVYTVNNGTFELVKVNTADPGLSTVVAAISGIVTGDEVDGMAFADADQLFVLASVLGFGSYLYQVDVATGDATYLGYNESSLGGLAFDKASGVMYAVGQEDSQLHTISTLDASLTTLGGTGFLSEGYFLEFDVDGILYCGDENLTKIDLSGTTPTGTAIGPFGPTDHIHGLVALPRPDDDIDAISVSKTKFKLQSSTGLPKVRRASF